MHNQNSFGIKYNCIHHEHSKPIKIFNNANKNDVNKEFVETLEAYAIESYNLTQQNKEKKILYMLMMKKKHSKKTECHECKIKFDFVENKKCAHHDHITGRFISSLCSNCNLKFVYSHFYQYICIILKDMMLTYLYRH